MAKIKHIELAGVDGKGLRTFYAGLFGWKISSREVGGFEYYDVDVRGGPSVGIRPEPKGRPEIVVYVEVADLDASVGRAETLGAKVRIPPMESGDLRFALIEDPEGNPIGLTQE